MSTKRKRTRGIAALEKHPRMVTEPIVPPSPPQTPVTGRRLWTQDYDTCKVRWGESSGELIGCAGMIGVIERFKSGDTDDSARFKLSYEDVEGSQADTTLEVIFEGLDRYPMAYSVLIISDDPLSRRTLKILARFCDIYELRMDELFSRILSALQGDEEADGCRLVDEGSDEEGDLPEVEDESESAHIFPSEAKPPDWTHLKKHFEQAKSLGYRPGLTQVSDFWVISMSVPLKNLSIDPNMLVAWDDGLVEAWREDQRLTLLVGVTTYPPHPDQMRFWLGFDKKYKPSPAEIIATTRGNGIQPFYLSSALLGFLKDFPRAYKVRTTFDVDWATADSVGLDEEMSKQVFQDGLVPPPSKACDLTDPVHLGYTDNLPVCAFWWTLRRFVEATKYCLSCGLAVAVPSLRPYVCDKPLCLYAFMSLGLGPSVEYVISHHPAVVDLLLTFAHSAATSTARMDIPTMLHIEVPIEFGLPQVTLLDDLPASEQRKAIAWLIAQLPRVSAIKAHLGEGSTLKQLSTCSGAIGVLRWVVGSCRAYLREVKAGEGVLGVTDPGLHVGSNIRQFIFVVGSPEQEANFKEEITKAQVADKRLLEYPTMLAFHGSGNDRWHNILRRGLDYQETTNGRAYGHGVYFASEYVTSSSYSGRQITTDRDNRDWSVSSAIALVELVNVPSTFVSKAPYYVVNQTKQIKPFLLMVSGTGTNHDPIPPAPRTIGPGELFQHDPRLVRPTTYSSGPVQVQMPSKLIRTTYVDDDEDDAVDEEILNPAVSVKLFEPSPEERFTRLQLMPPPSSVSSMATRTLSKELRGVIAAQATGASPFFVNPETETLYCWTLELHEFPDSILKTEMKRKGIRSVIAELRFPATYPYSPPFMRILHPRFLPFAYGGGGNITAGGSICNELLTSTGWNPAYVVEAVVRIIMVYMVEATPPARLDMTHWDIPYTLYEAMEAYKRVARQHNWDIPKDFDKMAL